MTRALVLLALAALAGASSWRAAGEARLAREDAAAARRAAALSDASATAAAEVAASCHAGLIDDLEAAHALAERLEVALRAVAATSACRERLPAPFPEPLRPLWCPGPSTWDAPLPTPGRACYGPDPGLDAPGE